MLEEIDLNHLLKIAREAGTAIMQIYVQEIDVEYKSDDSPITMADRVANETIVEQLMEHYPSIPIISEETAQTPYEERKNWEWCWLVDPLDGTKEFIHKNGEFTVNIALIHKGEPVAGVVHLPAKDEFYFAKKGEGAFMIDAHNKKTQLQISRPKSGTLVVVGSRSHGSTAFEEYVAKKKEQYDDVELIAAGSALKFGLVASGKAHEYPRLGPTMEWDTAAGDAVVREAGGEVLNFETANPLVYNKESLLNPAFIALAV